MEYPWSPRGRKLACTQTATRRCVAARPAAIPLRKESGTRCRCRGPTPRHARIFPPRASPEKTAQSPPYADNRQKKIRPATGSRQTHLLVQIGATGIRPVGGELRRARTRRHDRNSSPETQPHQISSRGVSPHTRILTHGVEIWLRLGEILQAFTMRTKVR